MAQLKKKFDWKILLLLPVPLFWGWADGAGYLNKLENFFLGLRFHYRGEIEAPVKIYYVDVDTRAIQRIGERPWNRARFAEAAQSLFEKGGAKAVAFDFVFSALGHSELVSLEDAGKGNVALGRVARKHPQLILAAQYSGGEAQLTSGVRQFPLLRFGLTDRTKNDVPELPQYPIFGANLNGAWGTIGLIDFDYERGGDETPRWAALFAETAGPTFWHMAAQLACVELGVTPGSLRRNGDFVEIVDRNGGVVRRIPLTDQQLLEVNWFSEWNNEVLNPRTSMADVLIAGEMLASEKPGERAEAESYFQRFNDAIVLIGPTDPLLQDLATTPFDHFPVPKIGAHGNLLKTIISEQYLQRPAPWVLWVSIFGLTIGVAGLTVAGGTRGMFSKTLAVLMLAGFVMIVLHLFAQSHLVIPLAAPMGAALTTGFIATIWQLIVEEKQKGRIKGMFSAYLAPTVVNNLIDSGKEPELGGHKEEITAYFSDIQSFSTFSELMPASQLVELMNEYLTVCTDLVQEEQGTLDKYIGDAVVAIFGAPLSVPDHAYRACTATIRVQKGIEQLRQKWKSEGDKWPVIVHYLRARLGLNTGEAIIGNMGSRTRFSYTMMGDNVNLAARMESGAKSLGVYTMITEATKLECEKHGGDKVLFRFLDRIVVKGRSLPVPVYEVVGFREEASPSTLECVKLHALATERYLAQDWAGAIELFQQSAVLELYQPNKAHYIESNPSLIMIQRCHYMKEHPPGANWDGVYVMKEK